MKQAKLDAFEKLIAQLESLHSELSVLARKAPNDAVNTFKLKSVNTTLDQCNTLFGDKYRPFSDFVMFSAEDVPSNSDVTFIISQYLECAEKFRSDNIFQHATVWWWKLDGERHDSPSMRTAPPKKLTKKRD
jgi:hypothetical protein